MAARRAFNPSNLHVLVVDGDPLCLGVLERMLKQCQYTVTTCDTVSKALALLRENEGKFNIVMSEVHLPNEDGFQLLEVIGLELDLPVIMMSSNEETSMVMKGIIHGACDYLIKPVRIQELKNIWQHVVRRMVKHVSREDSYGEPEESGESSDSLKGGGGEGASTFTSKKRKEQVEISSDEIVDDISGLKKARVMWSVQLHRQFVNAVNELGVDNAMPKRVLEIMNVQGLTRENVASHLQKYRLYLKRLSGLESTPCPIASFQARKDGAPGGMMQLAPGRKSSSITSGIKGLNLGAGLGVGLGAGKSLDLETKKSLLQFKVQKQQHAANRAQVLGALGLVDRQPHHHHQSTSTDGGGGLQRMCSLDLRYFLEETPPPEEVATPSPPPSSVTTGFSMKKKNNNKENGGGSDNDDVVGRSGEVRKSHANRWIDRTYSGSQIGELNRIRARLLQGSLEKQMASEAMMTVMKMEPIQEMASAPELPPSPPPPELTDSCSSSNHFPDLMRALAADNPQNEALSDFVSPPILPADNPQNEALSDFVLPPILPADNPQNEALSDFVSPPILPADNPQNEALSDFVSPPILPADNPQNEALSDFVLPPILPADNPQNEALSDFVSPPILPADNPQNEALSDFVLPPILPADNPQNEALSDFVSPPILLDASSELRLETLLDVSDYLIDDDDLFGY